MLPTLHLLFPVQIGTDALLGGLLGTALSAALLLIGFEIWRQRVRLPPRRLLGRLGADQAPVGVYVRQMFVPGNEFFSRDPESQGMPGSVAVRKWTGIPEVYDAAEMRAASDLIRLLGEVGSGPVSLRSVEKDSGRWNEDGIAIGANFKSLQVLEVCEPRLVAFRHPDAFRSLVSRDVFESKGGADFGLIYKGEYPSTHRTFLVVMGIGSAGTLAAANFLRTNLAPLGNLTGGAPFAAIITPDSGPQGQAKETATLRWLYPKPKWWRRLLHRTHWRLLWGRSGPPTA